MTKAGLLSFALLQFHEHHLFSRVFKHPPPTLEATSALLYLYFVLLWYWMWVRAGSSCFVVIATVTCALCLIAQTLQRLPVPFTFLSAAAPVWGWTFRSLCLSTLPWLPSTKVSCSNIAWCLFIDVLCCSKILYFKGFVYFVLKTSETEHLCSCVYENMYVMFLQWAGAMPLHSVLYWARWWLRTPRCSSATSQDSLL